MLPPRLEPAGRWAFLRRWPLLLRLGLRRGAAGRSEISFEWEIEPPAFSELTPRQLIDKFGEYPHLEQFDVQHHIRYLESRFPKSPMGPPLGLQASPDALQAEIEALLAENRALRAENERLRGGS